MVDALIDAVVPFLSFRFATEHAGSRKNPSSVRPSRMYQGPFPTGIQTHAELVKVSSTCVLCCLRGQEALLILLNR